MSKIIKLVKWLWWLVPVVIVLGTLLVIGGIYARVQFAHYRIYPQSTTVPNNAYAVAIVFGAGLRQGKPSPVLNDRLKAAASLYYDGKVSKILLSGDNRFVDYNEPKAMKDALVKMNVPEDALVLDYAGRRTYDTCYRARHIFGLNTAILVTNRFHLQRALYTCDHLGMSVVGLSADASADTYADQEVAWKLREVPASLSAWWEIHIRPHEAEIMGEAEPILF